MTYVGTQQEKRSSENYQRTLLIKCPLTSFKRSSHKYAIFTQTTCLYACCVKLTRKDQTKNG